MRANRVFLLAGGLAALAAFVIVAAAGDGRHRVSVVVPEAAGVLPGYQVRAAGRPIGEIARAEVTEDYQARVELLVDDSVWPLPIDSVMTLRLGGTIKLSDRYIEVRRGTSERTVPEGGTLPAKQFVTPVEYDDLFRTFDRATRRDLNATVDRAGAAMSEAAPQIRRAVGRAPAALDEIRGMLDDLGSRERSLHVLVSESDRLVEAINRSRPGIGALITEAGRTFQAISSEGDSLRRALSDAPATFAATRTTLARADRTLRAARGMSRKIAPGVRAARGVTGPLARVLATLDETGPDARAALATARRATPELNLMLTRTRALMPLIEAVSAEGSKQLRCIRPYAPEIASFASTWGAGAWGTRGDRKDKYLRSSLGGSPYSAMTPALSGADLHKLLPGLKKSLVRPPGQLIDQPWLVPECGVTEDTLDPTKDPESMKWDPLSKKLELPRPAKGRG